MTGQTKATLYCSFCSKSQHEVKKLIAGPTVFICNECVDLCKDIVDEGKKLADTKKWARENGYVLVKEDILINAGVDFPGKNDIANSLSKFNAFFKRKD